MKRIIQGALICATTLLSVASPCVSQQQEIAEAKLLPTDEVPQLGTFFSLTLLQPPFPFNPLPELPLYQIGEGTYVYDDRNLDYVALRALLAQAASVQFSASGVMLAGGSGSGAAMMNGPTPPGGGGGGGGGGGPSNPPPYSVPGLKLTIPVFTNGGLYTTVFETDTNSAYDLFEKFVLHTNVAWARIAGTEIGGTNFLVSVLSTSNAFYLAADTTDSDFDGVSDAFEQLVSRTNPLSTDSDNDGLPDGMEDFNTNGLPDSVEYRGLTRAVVFASRTNAIEGGQSGELTIQLPAPAPVGGLNAVMHLGGNTDYDLDYRLSTLGGAPVTNNVFVAAGTRTVKVLVLASNDLQQASRPRKVSFSLVSAGSMPVDSEQADVVIVENDLPTVSVVAGDAIAAEAPGAATNTGRFVLMRDGLLAGPLTVRFSVSGNAANGTDYTNINTPVVISADSNRVSLVVQPLPDTDYEDDEQVTLTLTADPAYNIGTGGGGASVTIKDDDLPVLTIVVTDAVCAEYNGPDSGTFAIRRTGNLSKPLTVPLGLSGTASNGVDYQVLTNFLVIPANASETNLQVIPIFSAGEEQAESVIVTIKGSVSYVIGASNTATIFIDDNSATRYEVNSIKYASVYATGIDSPAVFDIKRYGRSSQAATLPFQIMTNVSGGSVPTSFYRVYGDVQGNNTAVFPAFATKARLNFTAPSPGVTSGSGGVNLLVPSIDQFYWAIIYQPAWQFVRLEVFETNAVEGSATIRARLRLSRPVAGPAVTVEGTLTGSSASDTDHNLGSVFSMTLGNNATSTELIVTATSDVAFEGWETINIFPNFGASQVSLDPRKPVMLFLADNVGDTELLPAGDYDLDGLPDRWEAANGLDPFDPLDSQLDPDKDGLTNEDEYQRHTNAQLADTDGDGIKDFAETTPDMSLDSDFVEFRLVTRDTGKVNNGQNCAVCHTTELRVGDVRHYSTQRGENSERTFFLRKGTNYPMWLSELYRNLPPTPNTSGNPNTTATYTAAVVPGTNKPAAFVIQDPQSKLGTNKPWAQFPANPAVSFGTLIAPRIDVLFTNLAGNVPLDENTNDGGGLRLYPDATSPTDIVSGRDRVRVRVKTTPPTPLQYVRLKWFDVDDPFEHPQADPGFIIDANDATGVKGNDNRGNSNAVTLLQTQLLLDSQGEAVTDFIVSRQPGDNFRVASVLDTAGALNHLNSLQVTNANAPHYVSPGTNQVAGFVGTASTMLTVWRKLHLEFDSMTAPPASGSEVNWVNGKVVTALPLALGPNRSLVKVRHAGTERKSGLFERGRIEIAGLGTFRTLSSSGYASTDGNTITELDVEAAIGSSALNRDAKLYDDDDQYLNSDPLYPSILNLQSPPLPALPEIGFFISAAQPHFAAAYITLVNANVAGWNTVVSVPFKRYEYGFLLGGTVVFDNGNLQLKGTDRPEFWAFSVVFGYQAASDLFGVPSGLGDDGDPNSETPLSGGTPETGAYVPFSYSAIFMEAIREHAFTPGLKAGAILPSNFGDSAWTSHLRGKYLNSFYGAIAHEVGHAPGRQSEKDDHAEKGMMESGAPTITETSFTPQTIRRFRQTPSWTQ